jgi:RND family efflux transporter MFP subunit
VTVVVLAGGAWYYRASSGQAANATAGRGAGVRPAMTVDSVLVDRRDLIDRITVVGNLIGEQTVDVVPRVNGRLESIFVKMGDRVTKGRQVAKMEDRDVQEQVNQAQANLEVNKATVIQRESDLKVSQTTLDRTQAAYDHGLMAKQGLEDAQARYNSAQAQVSVAKSQVMQTQARIDELKITLSNTNILSPVDGFVGKRNLDPGAFAGANTPILSVVDLSTVRLVANLVEKDFKRVEPGVQAKVEVDAFPGETFAGRVSRVAPVFDPATRTAAMEIEVPNPGFRLKPGMYARVQLTAERRDHALVVPRSAIVDLEGQRGVYVVDEASTAHFKSIRTGLQDAEFVEVLDGLAEGERVVTVGTLALRDGDKVTLVSSGKGGAGGGRASGDVPSAGRR